MNKIILTTFLVKELNYQIKIVSLFIKFESIANKY